MKLPNAKQIAKMFALCEPYDSARALWPRFATPKLNGVRTMWVPDVGFFSRDGIAYLDGVLPHLEDQFRNIKTFVDCELYAHGMSLQAINSRVGIVRKKDHPDVCAVSAHVLDLPLAGGGFEARRDTTRLLNLKLIPAILCKCARDADNAHAAYVSAGYEGTVYHADGLYRRGRTDAWMKRKAWLDGEYDFVAWVPGEGKYEGTFGAVILRTPDGKEFCIGAFEFDDQERMALNGTTPKRAKIKYIGLTEQGVPYSARALSFDL